MGVSAVVGAGRPGPREGEEEIGGGVVRRGGVMSRGSGAGRDARLELRAGGTKVST